MHPDAATPSPPFLPPAPGAHERDGLHAEQHAPTGGPARRLSSRELLGSAREVEITHGDALYRLRLTSLGKLILTK